MAKLLNLILLIFVFLVVAFIPVLVGSLAFSKPSSSGTQVGSAVPIVNGIQEIRLRADPNGYSVTGFTVKNGVPVRILFSADQNSGCGRQLVMPDFGINKIIQGNEEVPIEFTPSREGSFAYRCSMNMFRGVMTVVA